MQLLALAALSIPSSPNPKSRAAVLQGAGRPWTPLLAPVGAAVTAPTGSPLFNLDGPYWGVSSVCLEGFDPGRHRTGV